MNEELMAQIQKVISEQLPAQIGDALKQRLIQADRESQQLIEFQTVNLALQQQRAELQAELAKHKEIDNKLIQLESLQRTVDAKLLRNEINELKVAQAEVRVSDMKSIVGQVFANNRYKYSESTYGNQPMASGGYTVPVTKNTSIETEG